DHTGFTDREVLDPYIAAYKETGVRPALPPEITAAVDQTEGTIAGVIELPPVKLEDWRLSEHTKVIGLRGVAQARAALRASDNKYGRKPSH
ncbi:MAG: hypothetical protein ABIQ89_03915, partial [Candidatus Saccharimonadales bacterium]